MPALARAGAAPLDLATDARVVRLPPAMVAPAVIRAILWLIAVAALLVPAAVVRFGPASRAPYGLLVSIPGRAMPTVAPPPVEPVEIRDLSPDAARAFNAGVPFSVAANPPARPFRLLGSPDDIARATDCLAAAAYYEAGEDPAGQRAVVQVVLNRVRHPAFPKTVCGVVFQGSERTTGCQFTFACDGALVRYTPTPDGWRRARTLASAALAGAVDRPVGHATHYHTEWVVPYWQASLDKIVAVHTQLFYRWAGWWGTPPAFDRHATLGEPGIAALARLSDAHRLATAPETGIVPASWADDPLDDPVEPTGAATAAGGKSVGSRDTFLVTLPAGLPPGQWAPYADQLCGARERCTVMAWRDRASTATKLPLDTGQIAAMAFSYARDRAAGTDRTLWNCLYALRSDPRQCMKRQVLIGTPAGPDLAGSPMPGAVADLPGIRRKASGEPAPVLLLDRPEGVKPTRRAPVPLTPPGTSPAAAP